MCRLRGWLVDAGLGGFGPDAGDREGEVEAGALAKRALDTSGAAVELGDMLDDAEAKAGAPEFPGARLVHAEESFKDSIASFSRDAGAVVFHAEVEFAVRLAG